MEQMFRKAQTAVLTAPHMTTHPRDEAGRSSTALAQKLCLINTSVRTKGRGKTLSRQATGPASGETLTSLGRHSPLWVWGQVSCPAGPSLWPPAVLSSHRHPLPAGGSSAAADRPCTHTPLPREWRTGLEVTGHSEWCAEACHTSNLKNIT